jgi:hypothetical protein
VEEAKAWPGYSAKQREREREMIREVERTGTHAVAKIFEAIVSCTYYKTAAIGIVRLFVSKKQHFQQ